MLNSPPLTSSSPPTLDPVAADRWDRVAPAVSPWLHEEVARRMSERLPWIKLQPRSWTHWSAVRGGLAGHQRVAQIYPVASAHVRETRPDHLAKAKRILGKRWWRASDWGAPTTAFEAAPPGSTELLWSNMGLHTQPDPHAAMAQWHHALAEDGMLMFSCLGPDTLGELRRLYKALGWPAPMHELTDMHDLGDMLIDAGFAEPVMDVERIVLSYQEPQRLLQELRELGRNLHRERFTGLRTPRWRRRLEEHLSQQGGGNGMTLTFEIIYGHAVKPRPRISVDHETSVPLETMRSMLKSRR